MTATARANNRFDAAERYRTAWTTTAGDYDIVANSPQYTANDTGFCSCLITAGIAGTVVVTDKDGNNQTLYFASGGAKLIQAKALVASGSTAQYVEVHW